MNRGVTLSPLVKLRGRRSYLFPFFPFLAAFFFAAFFFFGMAAHLLPRVPEFRGRWRTRHCPETKNAMIVVAGRDRPSFLPGLMRTIAIDENERP